MPTECKWTEDFVREGQVKRPSFVSDYFHFLKNNKKWWLLPILLMVLGATGMVRNGQWWVHVR